MTDSLYKVRAYRPDNVHVQIPGSKSYTHRWLIASALADGVSKVLSPLHSEDTLFTLEALRQMGVQIKKDENADFKVFGCSGRIKGADKDIYLGNSGTSMRLLSAVAALGEKASLLDGNERMRERPIKDLLDALRQIDIPAEDINSSFCPPVRIGGGSLKGGSLSIACNLSSQYLSALLLIAPCLEEGLDIRVSSGPVSRPYIDMTLDIMAKMGISCKREGYNHFLVPGRQLYKAGNYRVEPDASNASYFFAAAALSGGSICVKNLSLSSIQGDIGLLSIFEKMGCIVSEEEEGIRLKGPEELLPIDEDMSDMPDMVPGLAVVAAFAKGKSRLRNLAHLREKECDRLNSVAIELARMGARVSVIGDDLEIDGGEPLHKARISTYDDHRMAMSFSIAGLRVEGLEIENPHCVAKSFPDFFKVFEEAFS